MGEIVCEKMCVECVYYEKAAPCGHMELPEDNVYAWPTTFFIFIFSFKSYLLFMYGDIIYYFQDRKNERPNHKF